MDAWRVQGPGRARNGGAGSRRRVLALLLVAGTAANFAQFAPAQPPGRLTSEARRIRVRDPAALRTVRMPSLPPPTTVATREPEPPSRSISLDEAIRIGLANSEVVRVLTGQSATSSGLTIYDPAVSNTIIDQEQARFDPRVRVDNNFNRGERPFAALDPLDPRNALLFGSRSDAYRADVGLAKTTPSGGEATLGVVTTPTRFRPGTFPLNPQDESSVELGYVQPLLAGAGFNANLAPVFIARIETERSFFQYKDTVQELVRGIIEAYWALVFAKVNVWAREQQVRQSQFAYERAQAQVEAGLGDAGDAAQAQVAYANFRANLIAARADVLAREAALRNILGLPPSEAELLSPTTPPTSNRLEPDWDSVLNLAAERRPDIIELKLILEADQQRLVIANNRALPQVDAVALYRWNGLEGETPGGFPVSVDPGEHTDWTLGVNFSVPIGLRQARAGVRQQELLLARDRANLDQGLHNASHSLAITIRNLDLTYEQFLAFREYREAARTNLEKQSAAWLSGLEQFVVLLQAINDWGDAVANEAQALAGYNTELANLERDSGTILEAHSIRFLEERFGAVGPLGRFFADRWYPRDMRPAPNGDRYEAGDAPAESYFELNDPLEPLKQLREPATDSENELPTPPPDAASPDLSFVPQSFDRIETASAASGVEAEEDAYRGREHQRDACRPHRNDNGPIHAAAKGVDHHRQPRRRSDSQRHAHHPAHRRQ